MAGAALSAFGDFTIATSKKIVTGPEKIINEIQKKRYPLSRFLKGRTASEVLQGGKTINDDIFLDEASTFEEVLPGEDSTWQDPQVLSEYEVNWRFWQDHYYWLDQTVDLNEGDPKVIFKRVFWKIQQRVWTSMLNGADKTLFRLPNQATMEAAAGKQTYSLPAIMNEQTNTLFGTLTTAIPGGAWTTHQNISPATKANWASTAVSYGLSGNGFVPGSKDNVFNAFERMWNRTYFEMPGTRQEYFENPELYRQAIFCSEDGWTRYSYLLREQNEFVVVAGGQDPSYANPAFRNIELVYAPDLDTTALYPLSTAVATEANATATGPRYYWVNANYLKLIFHSKWYFRLMNETILERQPNAHVIPVQTWCNLVTLSRRRQGICYPAVSQTGGN